MSHPGHTPLSADSADFLHHAEKLGAGLPPLMIAADRIATTVSWGIHGRRRVGQGESFWQFRHYQSGDSIHNIDWRQSGKSQRVYIRQHEWEAAQSVWIDCDCSASMGYSSSDRLPGKSGRAAVLSLALASLLVRGDERVALAGSGRAPSGSRAGLQAMALALASAMRTPVSGAASPETLPKESRLVVFSDFLDDPSVLAVAVRRYVDQGVRGILVRIIDPAEETLPYDGRVLFEGFEREGKALIERVGAAREEYRRHWRLHGEHVAEVARIANWPLLTHYTDDSPEAVLLRLYMLMSDMRAG